jgi:hypothetical protein
LVVWISLRVLAPASLAAAGFGVVAAHEGHWPHLFFFQVAEAAFVFSFLLTVAVRLPLVRRARTRGLDAERLSHDVLALAIAELTVLYLAVADMVVKPSGASERDVRYGVVILALALVAAAAVAYRGRTMGPGGGVRRSEKGLRSFHERVRLPARSTQAKR